MDITVTREMGGMMEFERTGVYPSYLSFYIKKHKRTWRLKLRGEQQKGVLKLKGNPIYEYEFADKSCKMRAVAKDKEFGAWFTIKEIIIMMVD